MQALPQKIMLKVKPEKNIVTYANYALPLSVISADESKQEWYYEHFTEIYLMKDRNGYIWLDYLEDLYFPADVLDYRFIDFEKMKNEDNIVSFIHEKICSGFVMMLFVDMDCLKSRREHPNDHFFIQVLINGYDDEKKEFYGIGFNSDYQFTEIVYGYDEINSGYCSMVKYNNHNEIWVDLYTCVLMKIKEPGQVYKPDKKIIRKGLENYFYSSGSSSFLRPEIRTVRGCDAVYGLSAQQEVINAVEMLLKNDFYVDYRAIHLLCEQKNLIYRKITHICKDEKKGTTYADVINSYKKICRFFNKARLIYMMQVFEDTQNRFLYGQLKDAKTISTILDYLKRAHFEEYQLKDRIIEI